MKIQPLGDRVVVKPIEQESKTKSGIIIPDTVEKEKPEQAEVLAVGPGKMLENGQRQIMEVQVGQKVMFKKWAPDEVEIDKQKYLIIKSEDVIAIVE
ncbi:MAG: 10 kDa chaperonin [Candidatus Uhrbacteria bacterium GW2011_GWC1_41_20]|uniref:Co-chaperonin GroES n=1 Tax=Candidatus Uhrbacteria bacterium GW2011_GWC1_41_20 TaxID=1618983 RepID=A0A0G0VD69_9BACT|nr:MAG: 10 kDa chaperonin [Candidatus Uhrbacteria bacterium GW2011_GWC1_41_20]